jgi:hypothetical protein
MSRRIPIARMLILAMIGLSACGKIEVPVTGQLADGTPAAGQATADFSGHGSFWVQVPGGVRCSGSYDANNTNPSIVAPVLCNDGRRGEAVITRQLNGLSGTAIVKLVDGTRGQFVFGDLRFDQAFGTGGIATTASPSRRP